MIAYSMPLWTIFAKCPAPGVEPAWTNPESPSGLRASKAGCTFATSSSEPPHIRA